MRSVVAISLGKLRRLERCSTAQGHFVILAADHRQNLRAALQPSGPDRLDYAVFADFKGAIAKTLATSASAILLDPEFGLGESLASGALGRTGLIVSLEETGYGGASQDRLSKLVPGWTTEKAVRVGADAVKLLVYYHPRAASASVQEDLVQRTADECQKLEIPLFLEPLSFPLESSTRLSSRQRTEVVVETARRLTPLGVDVLKAEFPIDPIEEPDRTVWSDACKELAAATTVPWVLLSAGVSFDEFLLQTQIACASGASGVMAGRAIWTEATGLMGNERLSFLTSVAMDRLRTLGRVVEATASPWTDIVETPTVREGWFATY